MWNDGYVSEIDYVFGYFPEMSLPRLKLALLSRGIGHNVGSSPNYLELGFGQGLTLAVNATTCSGSYYGTDFNPSQAGNALGFAEASGKPLHIFDQSFEQIAARTDLPEFDVIAMHGIWSWVSDKAREAILQIIDQRLKPGGIVYVSHNVLPGWSPLIPLRKLVWEHNHRVGSGSMVQRMDDAIAFAERISNLSVGYFGAQPSAPNWLNTMKSQDRHYLAHEYFNAQWRPETISDLSDRLASVKLGFGASANVLENLAEKYMPPEGREILDTITDPTLRELTWDYLVNRKFRTDIFVKGARPLSANEKWDALCGYSFVRTGMVQDPPTTLLASFGKVDLRTETFVPIVQYMDESEGDVASFAELYGAASEAEMSEEKFIEALMILNATGYLTPTTDSDTIAEDYFASLRFNREICRRARYGEQARYLAAPGIGAGVHLSRLELLILHAMASDYDDIADYVVDTLARQNEAIRKENGERASHEEAIDRINALIETVRKDLLPKLERVGAIATASGNPFAIPAIEKAATDPMLLQALENGGPIQAVG